MNCLGDWDGDPWEETDGDFWRVCDGVCDGVSDFGVPLVPPLSLPFVELLCGIYTVISWGACSAGGVGGRVSKARSEGG